MFRVFYVCGIVVVSLAFFQFFLFLSTNLRLQV